MRRCLDHEKAFEYQIEKACDLSNALCEKGLLVVKRQSADASGFVVTEAEHEEFLRYKESRKAQESQALEEMAPTEGAQEPEEAQEPEGREEPRGLPMEVSGWRGPGARGCGLRGGLRPRPRRRPRRRGYAPGGGADAGGAGPRAVRGSAGAG